ncbi:ABC transporter permease [bacterium]|nr:ABC transporter permease [bacterium]
MVVFVAIEDKTMKKLMRKYIPPYFIIVAPVLIFLIIFLVYPISWLLKWSIYNFVPFKITDYTYTINNYLHFFSKSFYMEALIRTLRVSLTVSFITVLLAYPVAYFFVKSFPTLKRIGIFLAIMPIMVGLVLRSYGLIVLFERSGLVNQGLILLGIIEEPIKILNTEFCATIGLIVTFLPFAIVPLIASLEKTDPSVEEAGKILGCDARKLFLKVTLPLSLPGILAGFLIVFSMLVATYVTPLLLGGHNMVMMSTLVYEQIMIAFNWPFGAAIATILIIFSIIFLIISMKFSKKGASI